MEDVVDLLMLTTLEEVELNSKDLSGRLMTLSCGHSFTVETLDRKYHRCKVDVIDIDQHDFQFHRYFRNEKVLLQFVRWVMEWSIER